jgi:hypothetical protein
MAVYPTTNTHKVVEETEEEVDMLMQARQLPCDHTTTAGAVLALLQPRHDDNDDSPVLSMPVKWMSVYEPELKQTSPTW